RRRLHDFVSDVKAGAEEVVAPVYSHPAYDIVPDQRRVVRRPNILIREGLNLLQGGGTGPYVSDYFDFSIYGDADVSAIESWYVERFMTLRDTAFRDPDAYFHRYVSLTEEEALAEGHRIWTEINEKNLWENILHTRERATLIL